MVTSGSEPEHALSAGENRPRQQRIDLVPVRGRFCGGDHLDPGVAAPCGRRPPDRVGICLHDPPPPGRAEHTLRAEHPGGQNLAGTCDSLQGVLQAAMVEGALGGEGPAPGGDVRLVWGEVDEPHALRWPWVQLEQRGIRLAMGRVRHLQPGTPVLVLSARSDADVGARTDGFFPKPIQIESLLARIRDLVGA